MLQELGSGGPARKKGLIGDRKSERIVNCDVELQNSETGSSEIIELKFGHPKSHQAIQNS
jgi:hypothetical protein